MNHQVIPRGMAAITTSYSSIEYDFNAFLEIESLE